MTSTLTRPHDEARTSALDAATLSGIVRRLASDPSRWEHLVDLSGERGWARVAVPEGVDVWVLTWGPSSDTELHGHGDATAAFTVVRGEITEIRPDGRGELSAETFREGDLQTVLPGQIHDVRNDSGTPAVTIHAYGPSLDRMEFYRPERHDDGLHLVLERVVHSDSDEARAW